MPKKLQREPVDKKLLILAIILWLVGLLVLYSASSVQSYLVAGNTTYYFFHQLFYGGAIGLGVMYIFSRIDYKYLEKLAPFLVLVTLFLLLLVKVPGVGYSSGGASRWISLGPIFFQPAEFAKIAMVIYVASFIAKRRQHLQDFWYGLAPMLTIVGLFALLILWQPDLGTMIALILTALCMLFVGGLAWRHFVGFLGLGAVSLFGLIKLEPYRAQRLITFLNPGTDPGGAGYQINQALVAIGAGGLWGYGYGLSRQKHNYLPEVLGDSIFAVTAEELGYIRVLIILALFLLFALKGLQVALRAPDTFGKILGTGIVAGIMVQVIINIASISGVLPLTGIPLPLFSYGSSSAIAVLAQIGILLSISREAGK